jgi:hypothetical protein
MIARAALASSVVLLACTTGTPEPTPTPSAPPIADTKHATPPLVATKTDDCDTRIAAYLEQRAALSTCEHDSDCAEMWPGLCPHGPYYVHRDADVASVLASELAIMQSCSVPDCEPPIELGIAHCEAGKCTKGRAAPKGPCWDFRETNLEADGSTDAETVTKIASKTPHVVISPAEAGTLALELDWPASCSDCKLQISEHNSGMARLVTPKSSSTDAERNGEKVRHERLELPVTPGPYHMVGTSNTATRYLVTAKLTPAKVTRHGTDWQRLCED